MSHTLPRVVVIADDLTGANDTGLQITKRGIETITSLDRALLETVEAPGIVLDTESRTLSTGLARQVVRDTAHFLMRGYIDPLQTLVFKKIDSTLRGHAGAELAELVREYAPDRVICVPAYPKNGRTTRDGLHLLDGVPLDRTPLAGDPRNPVSTASLVEILGGENGPRFHHVALDPLRSGGSALAETLTGHRFLSFDCVEDADLWRIVGGVLPRGRTGSERILWCGSAGLAEVLLEATSTLKADAADRSIRSGRAGAFSGTGGSAGALLLFVVGSASEVSRHQVEALMDTGEAGIVRLKAPRGAASACDLSSELVGALDAEATARQTLILTALSAKMPPSAAGGRPEFIVRCLADAVAGLVEHRHIAGLFLTGGETAYRVLDRLGVRGIRIEAEIEAGVPAVRFLGGAIHGLSGVTKAGAFGDRGTMLRAAHYLKTMTLP